MKKDKLIKLLESIQGNPDIVLWNGMVDDWMDISPKLSHDALVKVSFDQYVDRVRYEVYVEKSNGNPHAKEDTIDELRESYRKHIKWEHNDFVTEEDIKEKRYLKKSVVFMDAKPRGVDTFDRLGSISY